MEGKVVDSETGEGVAGIEVNPELWDSGIKTTGADGAFPLYGEDYHPNFNVMLRDVDPDKDGNYKSDTIAVDLIKLYQEADTLGPDKYAVPDLVLKIEKQ